MGTYVIPWKMSRLDLFSTSPRHLTFFSQLTTNDSVSNKSRMLIVLTIALFSVSLYLLYSFSFFYFYLLCCFFFPRCVFAPCFCPNSLSCGGLFLVCSDNFSRKLSSPPEKMEQVFFFKKRKNRDIKRLLIIFCGIL